MTLAVGLMSGTSIDGIDAALIEIRGKSPALRIKLLSWGITPFPKGFKDKVLAASSPTRSRVNDICRLNFEMGGLFAEAVIRLCRRAKVPLTKLDVIGSHGQTVCHLGRKGTLQIGEPCVIAERTGVTTVADFRPRDIACGGFGAPLAPYLHYLLFRHPRLNRAVHNIGGISNLTYIPRGARLEDVVGFDTGPGNMVIDGLLREMTGDGTAYDHGGSLASKGIVSLKLLKELMAHPFIRKRPPKTSGREEFGREFVQWILIRSRKIGLKEEDIVATATAFTASSIAENYRRFIFPRRSDRVPDEIIFGGGGTHNAALMRMIRAELPNVRLSNFDLYGIPADAAEAVCFAVLAHETLHGRPTNLPSVTGAKKTAILGKIIPGARKWP